MILSSPWPVGFMIDFSLSKQRIACTCVMLRVIEKCMNLFYEKITHKIKKVDPFRRSLKKQFSEGINFSCLLIWGLNRFLIKKFVLFFCFSLLD